VFFCKHKLFNIFRFFYSLALGEIMRIKIDFYKEVSYSLSEE